MLVPPQPWHLRPMQLSDLPAVTAIDALSFPAPPPAKTYRYELLENRLAHYQVLLRQSPGEAAALLGHAGYWMIADEAHISTIAVDPAARGQGLGELLLLNMIYLASEQAAALVTLEVRRGNEVAQALYRKTGFEVVGERRGYYRDTGEDALLMTVYLHGNPSFAGLLQRRTAALLARLAAAPS